MRPLRLGPNQIPRFYRGGARIAAENKRRQVAMLRELVWRQAAEIDTLRDRLSRYEDANGVKRRRAAAIH